MLIKGIRSFSPENQNVIEFYRPLTIIVGQNGAGKTVRFLHTNVVIGIRFVFNGMREIESGQATSAVINSGFYQHLQTIIECLKMACTGELPPNTRSGQSFIHDPKVERQCLICNKVLPTEH